MPVIAHSLFYLSYVLIALATGLALSRFGGADAAGATLGGLSLFAAFAVTHAALTAAHAAGRVGAVEKRLGRDIQSMREAQTETKSELNAMLERLDQIEVRSESAIARLEAPPGEIKALEKLVDRLGKALDSRFDDLKRFALPAGGQGDPKSNPIDLVRDALRDSRVELHLQPIVSLPQRRTSFYEGYTRLKDASGRLILPAEFIPAAEAAGIVSLIDNALLFRCVQIVRKLAKQDRRVGIFCNLAPRSLSDELFFPQFLDFMHENRDLAGALFFEIPQATFDARTSFEARAMGRLMDLGFRFSIDKLTRFDVDLKDLERAGVRFVKANADALLENYADGGVRPASNISRELAAGDIAAVFRRYGIDLIAERVEHEDTVKRLLDLNLPFAQGHLFGAARPIKDSLMEETAPPPGFFTRAGGAHG